MTVNSLRFFHWIAALAALAALVAGVPAQAADRVVWKKTTVNESNESWRLDLEFHFSKPPDIAHVPIQFDFTQTVYYENTLDDSSTEPRVIKQPVENKQPMVETQDVGFLDPGTGKTQNRTRFTFKLTRARGFEAGEYKVQVRNKRAGSKIGGETKLVLNGTNEVIDRRSISFDEKKKPKDEETKKKSWEEEEYDPAKDPNNEQYWEGGPSDAEKGGGEDIPPPAHMQENPGACGCRVLGPTQAGGLHWLVLGAALSFGWIRRRGRRLSA